MTININNQIHSIRENCSLSKVMELLNIEVNGIAIAVNDVIVSKESWSKTKLKQNDTILIIQATQGG